MEHCHEKPFAVNKAVAAAAWGVNRRLGKPCENHLIAALNEVGQKHKMQPALVVLVSSRRAHWPGLPPPCGDLGPAWVCTAAGSQANCVQGTWGAVLPARSCENIGRASGRTAGLSQNGED